MPSARPIAVLSFDRPHYLEQVLRSLKAQSPPVAGDRVFLFQDGGRVSDGRPVGDQRRIDACIELFRSLFPAGHVLAAAENVGVALNVARAEDHMFGELTAEAAYFFEDDMVLSSHYLLALDALTEIALANHRIAYVAAYGDHHAALAAQRAAQRRIVPMVHRWGFALTRRQWAAQRPILAPYLDIVASTGYRDREDHRAIRAYYRKLGFSSAATTQDGMRDVASCVLGTAKVMSFACFGKYIGEVGLHSTRSFYEQHKFGAAEIYADPISAFDPPSDAELDQWVDAARNQGRAFIEYDSRTLWGTITAFSRQQVGRWRSRSTA